PDMRRKLSISGLWSALPVSLSGYFDGFKTVSKGVKRRRRINPIIKMLGAHFLNNPQVFENRNFLRNPSCTALAPDKSIILPDEPVIWASNHRFKDDTLASILAAQRHAYILFGSLPQFYNSFDGVTAWLNGVAMANRKVSASRKTSIPKAIRVINCGADLLIFPEGIWNKSPSVLAINLWPGIYRIACETGAKVVPIVHYLRDNDISKNNPIHTVIDDPIRIDNLSEYQALDCIRNVFASWYYLMIEAYGKTTRQEALGTALTVVDAWETQLTERTSFVTRYDKEIELWADYRPEWKASPQQVWRAVADVAKITPQNVRHVLYARELVAQCTREDFQHRF
ncbi:MAG: hypothetical protein HFG05_13325, partial [Oscillibacter sp.]|nr:hypothetical protein [Oscillibacter sp.]